MKSVNETSFRTKIKIIQMNKIIITDYTENINGFIYVSPICVKSRRLSRDMRQVNGTCKRRNNVKNVYFVFKLDEYMHRARENWDSEIYFLHLGYF